MKQIFKMLFSVLLEGILVYIAVVDINKKKITNRSLIILGVVGIAATYNFSISLISRLWGGMISAGPLFMIDLILPGSFGGGDIKLLAIAGGLLGWKGGLFALCAGFLAAGIYGVVMLAMGKRSKKDQIALGPFLCLGIAGCFLLVNK